MYKNNIDGYRNTKLKIARVLEMYKRECFDIPYIALYRKTEYEQELNSKDVWRIFELDKEWVKLYKLKYILIN